MGCIPCGSGGGTVTVNFSPKLAKQLSDVQIKVGEDCEFTQQLLEDWKKLLQCVKSKNIYDIFGTNHVRVNSYIGIVQSALNYKTYPCYFAPQLEQMKGLIQNIQNSHQCLES